MSMFTVYCNDSGTDQESRVAAVAEYIGESRSMGSLSKGMAQGSWGVRYKANAPG